MDIHLVSHASVVISTDVSIWTDPWLFGKAFNDSWSLFPQPALDDALYETIDFLYISHEHPDHFHIPTLKSLPEDLKRRVVILFQENNSDKVPKALNRLGFPNVRTLPHGKRVKLSDDTEVYCYQAGSMDSALAVTSAGQTVLNVNDCEINKKDCSRIVRALGKIDVVLNQFSIAGYSGFEDRENHLPGQSENVLKKMLSNHIDLNAGATIPFASYIYFSCEDNAYINDYSNRPQDAFDYFAENEQEMIVLYPGETYTVGSKHDSEASLRKFSEAYEAEDAFLLDESKTIEMDEIAAAFNKMSTHLRQRYPMILLRRLRPFTVYIPDLGRTVKFSIADGSYSDAADAEADLIIKSQPLHFGFSFPYGIQTLGVSARYMLVKGLPNWRKHRILFSLNNAELYLKPKFLFTRRNLRFFWNRLPGAFNQLVYRFKVMR